MYNNIDFNKLFDNTSEHGKQMIQSTITEDRIKRAENNLYYKLPNAYIEFIKIQNGGRIRNDESYITEIYGIAEDENSNKGIERLYSDYKYQEEFGFPDTVIPFATTQSGGHDVYCMDYEDGLETSEPKIVLIDDESNYRKKVVANSFQEFINMIYSDKNFDEKFIPDEDVVIERQEIQKKETKENLILGIVLLLIFSGGLIISCIQKNFKLLLISLFMIVVSLITIKDSINNPKK